MSFKSAARNIIQVFDSILFFSLLFIFASTAALITVLGRRSAKAMRTNSARRILRFSASNLKAIKNWKIESFLNSNLGGFFSRSVLVCMPNTVYEDAEYISGDIRIIQFSQHPDTVLKRHGFKKTNAVVAEMKALLRLYRVVREENIDIISAQDPHFMGGNALLLSRLTGIPYAIHIITDYDIKDRSVRKLAFPPFILPAVENAVEKFIFKNASFVTVGFKNYRTYAIKHGAMPARTFALNTYVNDVHFTDPGSRNNLKQKLGLVGKKMILYVGRLAPVKFSMDLIKCAEIFIRKRPDTVFVIVGTGPMEEEIVEYAKNARIYGNILFFKMKTQDELADMYFSSDVMVFPHAGTVLAEAALSAKPIVAYDYEWHPEVIGKDERGYLVEFRNYRAMAEKVCYVLDNYNEALDKAKKARDFIAKNFDKNVITSTERSVFERFFNESVNSPHDAACGSRGVV